MSIEQQPSDIPDTTLRWPGDRPVALVLNVMYEQWAADKVPALGPMGNPLAPQFRDYQAASWADYGWRTGIWRMLDFCAEENVRGTYYVSGMLSETAPKTLEAITSGGHEISGHSWSQDILPAMLDIEEERANIARCVQGLTAVGGQRPAGWISPRCTPSASTAHLLAEAGFTWFGDVFDADLPYRIDTPGGAIIGLPFGLDVNDLPMNVRYGQPARELTGTFSDVARGLLEEGRTSYIDVTLHAHVGARPAGMHELRRIFAVAKELDLHVATRFDVATRLAPRD